MNIKQLSIEYQDISGPAHRLRQAVVAELSELFETNNVTLGVPMESRIKTWDSISEKIERKKLSLTSLVELHDFIGIRSIFLFKRDLDIACELIIKYFKIISSEDTGDRLGDSEFGYQSRHLIIKIPDSWLSLPSLSGLNEFHMELQVRTLSQHIWAAASHKLQYKQEAGVPPPVRRAINRVSALLETVDLEFERVLGDRELYTEHASDASLPDELLNVDNLASLLSEIFPEQNKEDIEPYDDLLTDLNSLNLTTVDNLRSILIANRAYAIESDGKRVKEMQRTHKTANSRTSRGVFYIHVGLAREALRKEFGEEKFQELTGGLQAD